MEPLISPKGRRLPRWITFNLVSLAGVLVHLLMLAVLSDGFGLHYRVASPLAVEAALLHNYCWHECWTWKDRTNRSWNLVRLFRFNLTVGLVSIGQTLFLMELLSGGLAIDPLVAAPVAMACGWVSNFLIADRLVFAPARRK